MKEGDVMPIQPTTGELHFFITFALLLLLYAPLPFVVNKMLLSVHRKEDVSQTGRILYMSILALIAGGLCAGFIVNPYVGAVCYGALPWILAKRYQVIANGKEETFYMAYYVIFECVLLVSVFFWAMCVPFR